MTETLFCYAHPDRETSLRCRRCEKPMCVSCAQRTPTGYICKDCARQQQKKFETALWHDYVIGILATSLLSLLASGLTLFISTFIGFFMFFIAFAIAGAAGVFISNVTLRITGKRRSRALFQACAGGVILGALPFALFLVWTGNLFPLIFLGIYAVTATSTVYSRLAGIQL